MIKVGITGNKGFLGRHLHNYLQLNENIEIIPFQASYFQEPNQLQNFVKSCDSIVHLAAVNRHPDAEELYRINIDLVEKLVQACEHTDSQPHMILSSSTQENQDNPYGRSKLKGRKIIEQWAKKNNALAAGLVIPNIFGPFGRPNYNSFIATFCHRLIHNEEVEIIVDSDVSLIYVNDLIKDIEEIILKKSKGKIEIQPRYTAKVSKTLALLEDFKASYMKKGEFPQLMDPFEIDLFNTFRSYLPEDFFPFFYTKHEDDRGAFVEVVRSLGKGQFSYSTTKPGITRGNHFHTRKIERFAVIDGKALIQIRKVDDDKVIEYIISGDQPAFVDMPIWHTHNIKNIGEGILTTLFWINESYDPTDADTYFIPV